MNSSLDVEREPFMSTSAPTSPTKTSAGSGGGGVASLISPFDTDIPPNNNSSNICNSSANSNNNNNVTASSINPASTASSNNLNQQQQPQQPQQLNMNHPSNRLKTNQRSVKFPEEIVSGYHEAPNPYRYVAEEDNDVESVAIAYEEACSKQNIKPIPTVLDQIKNFKCNRMRAQDLILRGVQLDAHHCEALEEILKRVLFRLIDLDSCNLDCDGASALFDMIEFYESASHLSIAKNKSIGVIGWQALCRTLKKTACLQYLDLSNTGLNEQILLIMGRTIRVGSHLVALHLENAGLFGRRLAILVSSIKFNTSLRELYLGENKICSTDCVQLGNLLRGNGFLNVLDLRSNFIQDIGLDHICEGLAHQPSSNTLFDIFESATRGTISQNCGILIINLSDNQLTSRAMSRLAQTLSQCRSLIGLDLSNNLLGDDGIVILKEGLLQCRTLKYLNLSNTNITCEGATLIADLISRCAKLSIIDLSRNDLKFNGISQIRAAIKSNKSVTKMVLIPQNCHATKSEPNQNKIDQLIDEIELDCAQNKFDAKFDEFDEMLRGHLRCDISIYNDTNLNDSNNNFSFLSSNTSNVFFGSCDNMRTNQSESSDDDNNSILPSATKKPSLMRTASLGSWDAPKRSGRFSVSPVLSESESITNVSNPEIQINVDVALVADDNQESLVFRENVDLVETRSYSSEDEDNDSDLSHNETDQLSELPTKDMLMNRLMPPARSFRRMSTPTISELAKPVRKPNLKLKLSCNLESLDLRSSLPLSPTFFAKFDFSDLSLLRLPTEVEEIISNLPVYGDDFDDLIFNFDTENFYFGRGGDRGVDNGDNIDNSTSSNHRSSDHIIPP